MRISDWSSDVCSSDLRFEAPCRSCESCWGSHVRYFRAEARMAFQPPAGHTCWHRRRACAYSRSDRLLDHCRGRSARSEEHTSELQSLMRISYAVFCLKKKNKTNKVKRTS